MKKRYIYDPKKQILMVFENGRNVGGYIGRIAERKFEQLLDTNEQIELGEFLTANERQERFNKV
jgi:hypothetical protein